LENVSINPQNSRRPAVYSPDLTSLFPQAVVVVERRTPGDPQDLMPSEFHAVTRAWPKRLQEFAAGRACARLALAEFGVHGVSLPAAQDRQPVWPAGFVGSITHTTGLCVAAVARQVDVKALGVDSEIVGAPTTDIWATICRPEELAWIESLPEDSRAAAVTLIFSAKEAFYKCQYPLVGEWLDFHDLQIRADWHRPVGSFDVHPIRAILFGQHVDFPVVGQYAFHQEFVSAGVFVLADGVV
jgi:4'-phosphopantetheinyl transferase EntD